jgi:nucleotide-binding universal stress UspA family protein
MYSWLLVPPACRRDECRRGTLVPARPTVAPPADGEPGPSALNVRAGPVHSGLMTTSDNEAPQRPVVVGIDGSDSSIDALRTAQRLAVALGAPLRVVAAWRYRAAGFGLPPLGLVPVMLDPSPKDEAKAVMSRSLKAVFGDEAPAGVQTAIIEGAAAETLIGESRNAELLVVGSRGRGGFAGLLLGSVSAACAEHAHSSVLIVHDSAGSVED